MSRRPDGWYDPEEKEYTEAVLMGPKVFQCSGCGKNWRVGPVLHGRYWDYEGKCGEVSCGVSWVNRYQAFKKPNPDVVKQGEVRNPSASELDFE